MAMFKVRLVAVLFIPGDKTGRGTYLGLSSWNKVVSIHQALSRDHLLVVQAKVLLHQVHLVPPAAVYTTTTNLSTGAS